MAGMTARDQRGRNHFPAPRTMADRRVVALGLMTVSDDGQEERMGKGFVPGERPAREADRQ